MGRGGPLRAVLPPTPPEAGTLICKEHPGVGSYPVGAGPPERSRPRGTFLLSPAE